MTKIQNPIKFRTYVYLTIIFMALNIQNLNSAVYEPQRIDQQVRAYHWKRDRYDSILHLSGTSTNCTHFVENCAVSINAFCLSPKYVKISITFHNLYYFVDLMNSTYKSTDFLSSRLISLDNKNATNQFVDEFGAAFFDEFAAKEQLLTGSATIARDFDEIEVDNDYSMFLEFSTDLNSLNKFLSSGFSVYVENIPSESEPLDSIYRLWYNTKHSISDWPDNQKAVRQFHQLCLMKM